MRIQINPGFSMVKIDGETRVVDCADISPDIKVIEFDTDSGIGHIEYNPTPNRKLTDFKLFQDKVEGWKAASPPPPPPPEPVDGR